MTADIVESADLSIVAADEKHRKTGNRYREPRAAFGELRLMPDKLP